jgi:guanine deaminase
VSGEGFMRRALALAHESALDGKGGPFGAVITCEGRVVAEGQNQVTSTWDPTAHAEIVAIRRACAALERFELRGCEIYASCEPCPMCLAAIYWARLDRVYYANERADAARIGFDDEHLYREVALSPGARALPMIRMMAEPAREAFEAWMSNPGRIRY